jgi:hypothetical protein
MSILFIFITIIQVKGALDILLKKELISKETMKLIKSWGTDGSILI